MGISSLKGQGGGTDWSKYTPMLQTSTTGSDYSNIGTRVNIFTIEGSGFLDQCLASSTTGIGILSDLEIVIDGTVVCICGILGNSQLYFTGFCMTGDVSWDGYNNQVIIKSLNGVNTRVYSTTTASTYPALNAGLSRLLVLNNPVFFNSKLEVNYISRSTTNKILSFSIRGGVKI